MKKEQTPMPFDEQEKLIEEYIVELRSVD